VTARRIGLLGGSFDPVHEGHLTVARRARDQLALEAVWLLPADQPPHKLDRPLTLGAHRLEMLRRALQAEPGLQLCTLELDTPGVHYSVDTVLELRRREPAASFFFVMGEDSLRELSAWRQPEWLVRLAPPVVAPRGAPDASRPFAVYGVAVHWLAGPPVAVSSAQLRAALGRGERPAQIPRAVLAYIETHGLYRGEGGA
jgi:nicotinate-nucleotide adenylyltransferase